jgi:hypothetical protein
MVTGAVTFDGAKRLLGASRFDLFVSDVRLRGYNGLHLGRQAHLDHPDMATIIMTGYDEPMMELEAGHYGAVWPQTDQAEGVSGGCREGARGRAPRRWARKRVVVGFRVTAAGRPAAVVDVSYGGLRLEMAAEQIPPAFDVEVSGINLQLAVEPIWLQPSVIGSVVCGAALASDSTPAAKTWRAIVDRLTA